MSVYQNEYFIVPREGNYTLFEGLNLKSFLEDDLFEDDLFWDGINVNLKKINTYLSGNFPEDNSWSERLKIYGNNDTNSINLLSKDNMIESMSFRVNFTTDYTIFLDKLIELCKLNDLLIVDNDLNVLSLDYQMIMDNIVNSKAFERYKQFFQE